MQKGDRYEDPVLKYWFTVTGIAEDGSPIPGNPSGPIARQVVSQPAAASPRVSQPAAASRRSRRHYSRPPRKQYPPAKLTPTYQASDVDSGWIGWIISLIIAFILGFYWLPRR